MKEKIECPICGYMNLARQPTGGIPRACEKCGHNFIVDEEDDDDIDDEE
jgi:ribosomal protein L37AE/L43A